MWPSLAVRGASAVTDYLAQATDLLESAAQERDQLRVENERLYRLLGLWADHLKQLLDERDGLRAALGASAGGKVDWIVRAEHNQAAVERLRRQLQEVTLR